MKKLEIEKTKPTFIVSTFKTDIMKVGLVFSIFNFFITKTSLANKWMRKKKYLLAVIQYRRSRYYFVSADPQRVIILLSADPWEINFCWAGSLFTIAFQIHMVQVVSFLKYCWFLTLYHWSKFWAKIVVVLTKKMRTLGTTFVSPGKSICLK